MITLVMFVGGYAMNVKDCQTVEMAQTVVAHVPHHTGNAHRRLNQTSKHPSADDTGVPAG